jgi:chemotaxis protein MotB
MIEQGNLLKAERDRLKQTKIDLENQLTESRNHFQSISQEKAAKDQKLSEMEADRKQLLSRVTELNKEKEELARLESALKNQIGMTQSQIEALSMDTAAKEEQLKTKENQLISMEKAYQQLSKQFEQQINEKEIKISNLENKLNIRLLDKILFASGRADITSDGNGVLKSLATELQKMDGFEISVAGHTDNKLLGPKIKKVYYDNLGLSVARAAAVSRKLREMGVSPANLSATGYSMYHPLVGNDTKEERQQNRRVEIILEPLR